ncbi:lipopolysaccharide biosynthesis protein [Oricola sp.]|uniref:lipopolysaccharide biosynthesis protein n=1 Tax=Oricola sp. TaxID=1979950 RepID=UPI003BA84F20
MIIKKLERLFPQPLVRRLRPPLLVAEQLWNGRDDGAVARRMSVIAFLIRVISAGIAFVSQVVLARWTGTFDYGIYVFVWTAMIILGNLSCFGFQTAVIRFLPMYRKEGALDHLRGILLTSRLFVLVSASSVAALGIGIVLLLGERIGSYYLLPFVLGFTCLPMLALGDVLDGTARANSWPVRALTPTYIVRPTLVLLYLGILHLAGFEPSAVTAVIAAVLSTYTTTLGQLVLLTRRLDSVYEPGARRTDMSAWVKVALPIFLVEGIFFLQTNADVLMVGLYMSPDRVAIYFATVKTLALVHFVFFAVKAGVAQEFAARTGVDDRDALRAFARRSVGWTFWPSLLMGAIVLVLGKPLLSMFGPEFVSGYPYLFVLVAGVILRASVGPAESLLNMTGNQNACAVIFGAILAINIALNMMLIPAYGLMGAAIATAAATLVEALLLVVVVYRRIGLVMLVFAPAIETEVRP